MTGPANTTDLANRSLRALSEAELQVGGFLLEDAWNAILAVKPFVADRLADDRVFSLVVQVQCAAALRVLANPDGKLEESGDDYSYRLDAARSTGALYISDAELALLGEPGATSPNAFTIKPGGTQPDRVWREPWMTAL